MKSPSGHYFSDKESETTDESSLDEAVRAVGHPGRRAMLRLARDSERTAADLAQAAGLSASAASQHLKVLRDVGLLDMRADAQRRLYQANTVRLAQVKALLDELWSDRLGALAVQAEADERAGLPIGAATEDTA